MEFMCRWFKCPWAHDRSKRVIYTAIFLALINCRSKTAGNIQVIQEPIKHSGQSIESLELQPSATVHHSPQLTATATHKLTCMLPTEDRLLAWQLIWLASLSHAVGHPSSYKSPASSAVSGCLRYTSLKCIKPASSVSRCIVSHGSNQSTHRLVSLSSLRHFQWETLLVC